MSQSRIWEYEFTPFIISRFISPKELNFMISGENVDESWWKVRALTWYGIPTKKYDAIVLESQFTEYHRQYLWVLFRFNFVERGSEYYFFPTSFVERACNARAPTIYADMLQKDVIEYALKLLYYPIPYPIKITKHLFKILEEETILKLFAYLGNRDKYIFGYMSYGYINPEKIKGFHKDMFLAGLTTREFEEALRGKSLEMTKFPSSVSLAAEYIITGKVSEELKKDIKAPKSVAKLMMAHLGDFDILWNNLSEKSFVDLIKNVALEEKDINKIMRYKFSKPSLLDIAKSFCHPILHLEVIKKLYDLGLQTLELENLFILSLKYVQIYSIEFLLSKISFNPTDEINSYDLIMAPYYYDLIDESPIFLGTREDLMELSPYELEVLLMFGIEPPLNAFIFDAEIYEDITPRAFEFLQRLKGYK